MKISILAITVLAFLAIIVLGLMFIRPGFEDPSLAFVEEPLHKNTMLQISDGDVYEYKYYVNNTVVNITYVALQRDCTVIFISESVNKTSICLDKWGMDKTKSNSSFEDPSFILFKPWMLALEENWSWKNSMYLNFDGVMRHIADNSYRVVGTEDVNGRRAYKVAINSTDGTYEYDWVDVEKRILLKIEGEGFEVGLVDDN